jgi:hypothetical protein
MQDARVPQRIPFAFMAITAAISTAFIFGLVAMLSWQGCLMLMLVAAALTGGGVFTIQEMRSLVQEAPRIERSAAKTR